MKVKSIITKNSESFLEDYINNPSPTGFESGGQKLWLNYIKPYIDTHFVDTYGTNSQPYYVFLNHQEEKLLEPANFQDFGTVELFSDWLNRGLKEFYK